MKNPLAEITELVRRETGIALPAAREAALRAALRRAAPGTDPAAFLRSVSDPAGGRGLMNRLIDASFRLPARGDRGPSVPGARGVRAGKRPTLWRCSLTRRSPW
jgi:hypothetical protein